MTAAPITITLDGSPVAKGPDRRAARAQSLHVIAADADSGFAISVSSFRARVYKRALAANDSDSDGERHDCRAAYRAPRFRSLSVFPFPIEPTQKRNPADVLRRGFWKQHTRPRWPTECGRNGTWLGGCVPRDMKARCNASPPSEQTAASGAGCHFHRRRRAGFFTFSDERSRPEQMPPKLCSKLQACLTHEHRLHPGNCS